MTNSLFPIIITAIINVLAWKVSPTADISVALSTKYELFWAVVCQGVENEKERVMVTTMTVGDVGSDDKWDTHS